MVRTTAILLVTLLLSPFPWSGPAGAAGGAPQSPVVEWTYEYPRDAYIRAFNDSDGDGIKEIILARDHNYTFMDLADGGKTVELHDEAVDPDPRFEDLGGNGSVQILVVRQAPDHFNISIMSGSTFRELHRSPDINGRLGIRNIVDVDADGKNEYVSTVSEDNRTRLFAYGVVDYGVEWLSPPLDPVAGWWSLSKPVNTDLDSALELVVKAFDEYYLGFTEMRVYDGASHELQWDMKVPADRSFSTAPGSPRDVDNDSVPEFVVLDQPNATVQVSGNVTNGTFGISVISCLNGSLERSIDFGRGYGFFYIPEMYDFGLDGRTELLLQYARGPSGNTAALVQEIFDIRGNRTMWSTGPHEVNRTRSIYVYSEDIDDDGSREIVISNVTDHGTENASYRFQVLDGQDFSVLWTSPEQKKVSWRLEVERPGGGLAPLIVVREYDSQPPPPEDHVHGRVRLVSTRDFQEVWASQIYDSQVGLVFWDVLGDPVEEAVISSTLDAGKGAKRAVTEIVEVRNFTRLLRLNLSVNSGPFHRNIDSVDFDGDGAREILFVNVTWDGKHNDTGYYTWGYSTMSILNGTTGQEVWRSQKVEKQYDIDYTGDFDNDGNVEVLFQLYQDFSDVSWYQLMEFPRAGTWAPTFDGRPPTIVIQRPADGSTVRGRIGITGTAADDAFLSAVEVRIDDGAWLPASVRLADGLRSCEWNLSWDASKAENGTHRISARASDGHRWSAESSVSVNVQPPGTEPPRVPQTTIGGLPGPVCSLIALVIIAGLVALIYLQMRKS